MKAAVYYENGPPDVLKYEDVPDPQCHPKGNTAPMKHPQARVLPEIVTQPGTAPGLFQRLSGRQPSPQPPLEFSHSS